MTQKYNLFYCDFIYFCAKVRNAVEKKKLFMKKLNRKNINVLINNELYLIKQ